MFLEPQFKNQRRGWIEVICGSMFSGKTEELLRRIRRTRFANQRCALFKPSRDVRYDAVDIVSHDANRIPGQPVDESRIILELAEGLDVIGIDEAQFFDQGLVQVAQDLAHSGIRVIIAGLDMDFRGKPFGPMPALLAVAEYITKLHAICPHCGSLATHSYRKTADESTILLGEQESYEPRCRVCYRMGNIMDLGQGQAD